METKSVERYLESFGKQVVNRAKANLGRAKGGSTKLATTIQASASKFVILMYLAFCTSIAPGEL